MSSLFRKEALEHRKDRLYGEVVLLQPLSMTILVSTVVVICMLILTILFWGTYARKENVKGYLIPDKGIVKIFTSQAGTISKVEVREGDEVVEGQTLATIASERTMQGGSDIESMQLHEIESTIAHQTEQIKEEKALSVSETARIENQILGLKRELEQTEQTLKSQQDRIQILESRVAGLKKLLESKNISQTDYQKIYEEYLVQKQRYQDLLSSKSNKENNLSQSQSELQQLPIKFRSRIHEIENKISELRQRYAEIKGRRALEIRSPIAGTVTALTAREGQRFAPDMSLMAIIPKDAVLQVELFIPSRAIGFITVGQTVRIRYDAFPYQRFGIYQGKVSIISKHVLLPNEAPIPLESKEPVYRVTVNLDNQFVMAYGKAFPLQAGMGLEADIILEKQTLFGWILEPLISLKGRF